MGNLQQDSIPPALPVPQVRRADAGILRLVTCVSAVALLSACTGAQHTGPQAVSKDRFELVYSVRDVQRPAIETQTAAAPQFGSAYAQEGMVVQPVSLPLTTDAVTLAEQLTPGAGNAIDQQALPLTPAAMPGTAVTPATLSPATLAMLEELSHQIKEGSAASPDGVPTGAPIVMERAREQRLTVVEESNDTPGLNLSLHGHRDASGVSAAAHALMDRAYSALNNGQNEVAIVLCRQALEAMPDHPYVLLSLATAYHRSKQLNQAREYYTRVLNLDPGNAKALNNMLALVGEEAPLEALAMLDALWTQHASFSPLPAQMGLIAARLGDFDMALRYLAEAVRLEPSDMQYRYNLAVLLDRMGRTQDAAKQYQHVLQAALSGISTPMNAHAIQQRLISLASNS